MKLSKILGFLTVVIFLAAMMTMTAMADIDLGDFAVIESDGAQNGWNISMDDLLEAKGIYLEFNEEMDGIIFVLFGDGNGWGWPATNFDVSGKSITIDFSELPDYEDVMNGTTAKILMMIDYSTTWDEVGGLKSAKLISDASGAAVVAPPAEAPAAVEWVKPDLKIGGGKTIINAIDFDSGVYFESNAADGNHECRPAEDVQTEVGKSEFGGNIGWTAADEWVQYTVKVDAAGKYGFNAWMASDAGTPGTIQVFVNDVLVGETANSLKRGWQDYDLYPVGAIDLAAGTSVIKVLFPNGNMNFSALEINADGSLAPVPAAPVKETKPADEAKPADNATSKDVGSTVVIPPRTGDMGIIIFVAIMAAACVIIFKRKISVK
jgi:hypothetical protein